MPSLYNCKHSGDQYRISKFDSDFNLEASYLCDLHSCECPAGHRSRCRHREMLPKFIQCEHIGDGWFYDRWVQGWKEGPAQGMTDDEASEMLKQPNEFADKILEERDRIERAMQEKYGSASEALPIQQTAEQKANMAFMQAGGMITKEYMTNGSVNTFKTIDHESIQPKTEPSPSPTIRRRV